MANQSVGLAVRRRYLFVVDEEGVDEARSSMTTAHGHQSHGNSAELEDSLGAVFDELRLERANQVVNMFVEVENKASSQLFELTSTSSRSPFTQMSIVFFSRAIRYWTS